MPTTKSYNFEGGTIGAAVAASQAGSGDPLDVAQVTNSATLTYDNAQVMHGTKSLKVTPTATGQAQIAYATSSTGIAGRLYFYFTAVPAADFYIMRAETGVQATTAPRFVFKTTGKLLLQDAAAATAWTSTTSVPLNQWVRVELFAQAGADTATGALKGGMYLGDSTTPIDPIYSSTTANAGTATFTRLAAGKTNASQTYATAFWADDFKVIDGATDLVGAGGNIAPVVTPGAAATAVPGAAFSLPFTASDADGNALTYSAAADPANPAALGTLAVTATAVTGTAPATAGKYVVNVTANDGTVGTTAPLVLYVPSTSSKPYTVKSNSAGWTSTGGTIPAVLADTDTATYVESPDNPAGSAVSVTSSPYTAGASATISYAVSQNTASPARSVVVGLYMGNTLIASKTETLTAGITQGTLDLTAGQLAAWTDRTEPELRFTAS